MQIPLMTDFRRLRVWRLAQELSVAIYRATECLDVPGLWHYQAQIRRAASSIAANIAEGASQETQAQFARYLSNAIGSTAECMSHLLEVRALDVLLTQQIDSLVGQLDTLRGMLIRLRIQARENARASLPTKSG